MTDNELHKRADKVVDAFKNEMRGRKITGAQMLVLVSYLIVTILMLVGNNNGFLVMYELWKRVIAQVGETVSGLLQDEQKGLTK